MKINFLEFERKYNTLSSKLAASGAAGRKEMEMRWKVKVRIKKTSRLSSRCERLPGEGWHWRAGSELERRVGRGREKQRVQKSRV